jgi:hypothetical protein
LTWIILFKKMWLASCTVLLCQRYNANTWVHLTGYVEW